MCIKGMNTLFKISESALPLEGILILGFFLAVFITSLREKEERPAYLALLAAFLLPVPFLLPFLAGFPYPGWISTPLFILFLIPLLALFLPFRGRMEYRRQDPVERPDERDTMFSRRELVPGTERFDEYYARRPGNKPLDNKFRRLPGLLKAGTTYFDPILFAAAGSIFDKVVDGLHPRVEGEPAGERPPVTARDMSRLLLGMAVDWGALSAGITELREHHVYSVGGRGERYGIPYRVEHKYALALTVEMDYEMMRAAPHAPAVLESARQYLQSGMIAVQLAEFIRSLGYPARAHIDGNYKVVCPLVARDAGLGEIGRMGLLMTPRVGPRCRIAVVTTDLPLVPGHLDRRPGRVTGRRVRWQGKNGSSAVVIDFCRRCEKCALACPGQSIPLGPERETGGVKRWKIDPESCYTYWCRAGTDCGRCMIVCPWSHPDNWFHRLVRFGIRNNVLFRRLALPLDDLFYGRKPAPRKPFTPP